MYYIFTFLKARLLYYYYQRYCRIVSHCLHRSQVLISSILSVLSTFLCSLFLIIIRKAFLSSSNFLCFLRSFHLFRSLTSLLHYLLMLFISFVCLSFASLSCLPSIVFDFSSFLSTFHKSFLSFLKVSFCFSSFNLLIALSSQIPLSSCYNDHMGMMIIYVHPPMLPQQ